jgi:serine/threonine protein kinase
MSAAHPTDTPRRKDPRRHGVSPMPSPATETLTDRRTFLEVVRAASILTANQLAKAKTLAPTGSAADAARAMVATGLITRFQADRLLAGRTDGFSLGPYVILEQVGRGTMSRVYKAKHRTMNRLVAIKVLSSSLTRTAAEREGLQQEVRAAGKLAHPNIVTAYDANELQDRFYLVLEFVDGPSLDSFVRQRGPLPVPEACEFIRQTAIGLQHAHEKGMVHRDLKPRNLLVARPTPSAPLTVKIADFGIPKAVHGPTDFTAPEQAGSTPVPADSRADLYSLGCVFYFLLTGRAPGEYPVPIGQVRPDMPPEVAAIVHRLLAKNPAARFVSAAELLIHLDAACVPVAIPVDDAVDFDMPAYPVKPGHDSGYLTGRAGQPSDMHPLPGSDTFTIPVAEPSPWAQLTDEMAEETQPLELDDTPLPLPYTSKPPGHGESVPLWMTATLLVGIVLLCLMGIGAVIKLLVK